MTKIIKIGEMTNTSDMTIKLTHERIDGLPFKSTLLQQIPLLEDAIIVLAEEIAKKNRQLLPSDELESKIRKLKTDMDFKTRQLLMYK